jgi:glyoxylase-like metal-dependent hydrolase (beta-lactamase superfamily II)
MLKRIGRIAGVLLILGIAAIAVVLVRAHRATDRETPPLPSLDAVAAVAGIGSIVDDPPVRLAVINTASQVMPRSAVLERGRDPHPDAPYVMSFPAFALQWRDGRILLVDAGMTRAGALDFGKPIQWLGGADPIVPHASVGEALGEAAQSVKGILFTHLHTDHVGGIVGLCPHVDRLRVLVNGAQADRPNYTTRPGLDLLLDAECARLERLGDGPLVPVTGFPGVFVIHAGGHTPGSQIVLAFVEDAGGAVHRYAFTGDIVNNADGILFNVPKPWLYRLLVVPESEARQAELREFLKRLRDEAGFVLVVSHDQQAIEATGISTWPADALQ